MGELSVNGTGKRGAPFGNRNGAKGKEWQDALKWALRHYETDALGREDSLLKTVKKGQALRAVALRVVDHAIEGKEYAVKEVSERLDGKVSAGDAGGPLKVVVVRGIPNLLDPIPVDRVPIPVEVRRIESD